MWIGKAFLYTISISSCSTSSRVFEHNNELLFIDDYFLRMHNLVYRLLIASHSIFIDKFIMYLLDGFALDFDIIICQVQTRQGLISLEELHSLLVAYETRLHQHTNSNLMANAAFIGNFSGFNGVFSSNPIASSFVGDPNQRSLVLGPLPQSFSNVNHSARSSGSRNNNIFGLNGQEEDMVKGEEDVVKEVAFSVKSVDDKAI